MSKTMLGSSTDLGSRKMKEQGGGGVWGGGLSSEKDRGRQAAPGAFSPPVPAAFL